MKSFGTDYIIDPFDTFALHLATAFQTPCLYLLQEWLSGLADEELKEPIYPPRDGHWVICGYGRFGKAIDKRLQDEGLKTVVIEATPDKTGLPENGCVTGRGTEAATLQEAGIEEAVGLVAGTDHDANNLSIIVTARELNPDLFVVVRQNYWENQPIIDAVEADMVMHPSSIIANKIRVLLATPLLYEFIGLALFQDNEWACQLDSRITALVDIEVPAVWEVTLSTEGSYAVSKAIRRGHEVTLGDILRNPRERERDLPCITLLLLRGSSRTLVPEPGIVLKKNDRLLFCGHPSAESHMQWTLQNEHTLCYVMTGESASQGWVWRLLQRKGLLAADKK